MTNSPKKYNEDTFFCYYCYKNNFNLPSFEKSSEFSTEQVLNKQSIGFHKMLLYHKLNDMFDFLQKHYEKIVTSKINI